MGEINIGQAIKLITGKEPTPQQVEHIQAIAHSLDIPNHDAMLAILAALDTYHGAFSSLPKNVSKACDEVAERSAKNASDQAQAKMNSAVALLVPTVEKAVAKAAKDTVDRIQIGQSLFTIFLGLTALGSMFVFGWICGAHLLSDIQEGKLSWAYFWSQTWSGLGLGVAAPALMIYGYTWMANNDEYKKATAAQWTITGLGLVGVAVLILHQFGVIGAAN
ncbi:MAG: hypothetical protein WB425_18650 [Terracidiphilus sp.]